MPNEVIRVAREEIARHSQLFNKLRGTRDPERIEKMLSELRTLWEKEPDLRLGQIIVNAMQPTLPCPEIFYVEDDVLLQRIRNGIAAQR